MNSKTIILDGDIIALDLGRARTGVARIHTGARIAEPLDHIDMNTMNLQTRAKELVDEHTAKCVVVGLPRGLDGQQTDQTRWSQDVIDGLKQSLDVPVFAIDEAGTTKRAEELQRPGQNVDSVAAGIIASDFLSEVQAGRIDNVSF